MAKVSTFDKQNLKTIRTDIDAALAAVAKKHGIVLKLGNISYTESTFTSKVTAVTEKSSGGEVDASSAKYARNFLRSAFEYGLTKTALGKKVIYAGKEYTLVGSRSTRARLPMVIKGADGKLLAVTSDAVKRGLALVK